MRAIETVRQDVEGCHIPGSRKCVVAFASGGGESGEDLTRFEFARSIDAMGVSRVLLRDSSGCHFQFGVDGVGPRAAVVAMLRGLAVAYSDLVLMGLSIGSYAALMYGQIAACPSMRVLAISPYTTLLNTDPDGCFDDPAWRSRAGADEPILDLAPLFPSGPRMPVRAFVSDGAGTDKDRWMAERIGISDVTFLPGSSHAGLARLMRDQGTLRDEVMR